MKKCFVFLALVVSLSSFAETLPPAETIGRDPTWYPLQLGTKTNNLTAFTNALIQAISDLGHPMQIVDIDWLELMQNLQEGHIGGAFSTILPNLMNQEKYSFSEPFIYLGPVLIVAMDSKAECLANLNGKRIGVYKFDDSVRIAQRNPAAVITLYENKPEALDQLNKGGYDAVLMPALDAHALVENLHAKDLKIISGPLNQNGIRLITLKDENLSLIENFNQGLIQLYKNGTYASLRRIYLLY